jgi:predicted transcriptional regulator
MKNTQALLESIGLNHHESRIYLYLLEFGEQAGSKIANALKVPRSTVRNTLDKLCERGIVTKIYKRNTQYYFCKKPSSLLDFKKQQIEESTEQLKQLQESLPLLSALHSQRNVVPKVRFFEGKEGVIEAFNHSLFVEGIDEILFFTSYQFLRTPVIRKNDVEFYMPMRIQKKKIPMRVLVGYTDEADKLKLNDPKELRQRRFIPKKYTLPGNIHIYGDFVVYFSAGGHEHMAVMIESRMMADTMRALFEFMWEQV